MCGQLMVTPEGRSNELAPLEDINTKIAQIRDELRLASDATSEAVSVIKEANANPGANYYWLIFVALYAGSYFYNG